MESDDKPSSLLSVEESTLLGPPEKELPKVFYLCQSICRIWGLHVVLQNVVENSIYVYVFCVFLNIFSYRHIQFLKLLMHKSFSNWQLFHGLER